MKVLLLHNRYRQRGGEDMVFEDERALLLAGGHEVREYVRSNDDLDGVWHLKVAASSVWSSRSVSDLESIFKDWRPDVMHVHNMFYALSASIYWVAARFRVPVVQTLHNFRLMCLQGTFFREGQVCEDCLGRAPMAGVRRACFQGSVAQSLTLGVNLVAHRAFGSFSRKVHRFIALNEFSRDKFIQGGLDPARIVVKPNFAPRPAVGRAANVAGGLYIGRLSEEKGIGVLAQALSLAEVSGFTVAGTGPDAELLAGGCATLLGWQTPDQLGHLLARASYVVIPSLTYEQFPRVLAEAFAMGVPVIAPALGPLATLVRNGSTGVLFKPGDAKDLARVLTWAEGHAAEMAAMGANALVQYEAEFSPEQNLRNLLSIYQGAVACQQDLIPA